MDTTKEVNNVLVFEDLHQLQYLALRITSLLRHLNLIIKHTQVIVYKLKKRAFRPLWQLFLSLFIQVHRIQILRDFRNRQNERVQIHPIQANNLFLLHFLFALPIKAGEGGSVFWCFGAHLLLLKTRISFEE